MPVWVTVCGLAAGGISFVLWVINAVARGQWMPRSTVDQLVLSLKERLAESRESSAKWENAYDASESARRIQAEQIRELIVLARTTEALLKALPNGRET